MDDERDLLARWRAGDRLAGNQLALRCLPPIRQFFASKTRSEADTDELTQKTFVELIEKRDRIVGTSTLAYSFGIAHNLLKHYYRDLQRDLRRFDVPSSLMSDLGADARTRLESAQWLETSAAALRAISPGFQVVIVLYYLVGLDVSALAEKIGMNANTVRGRLFRARHELRTRLREMNAYS